MSQSSTTTELQDGTKVTTSTVKDSSGKTTQVVTSEAPKKRHIGVLILGLVLMVAAIVLIVVALTVYKDKKGWKIFMSILGGILLVAGIFMAIAGMRKR